MLLHETTETAVPEASDAERVRAAIAQLPPIERDLLVLRFRDGLDVEGLALATGRERSEVQRRLHDAAWVVEDVAGPAVAVPWQGWRHAPSSRSLDLVVEDAALGITPELAARLTGAVEGDVPDADRHWRLRGLLRGLQKHADGVLVALAVILVVVPIAASLVSV